MFSHFYIPSFPIKRGHVSLVTRSKTIVKDNYKYLLKLKIGEIELSRPCKNWDELRKLKDIIKPFAKFDSVHKIWEVKEYIKDAEELAEVLSKVFNLDSARAKELIEIHNKYVIKRTMSSVKFSLKIVSLGWLDDDAYKVVKKYCRKLSRSTFEFDPSRFIGEEGVLGKRKEDYEKALNNWLKKLKDLGLIFDGGKIKSELDRIWEVVQELRTVRASYVVEKDNKGKERGWIRLEFNKGLKIWDIKEELMKIREIPYNIEVFEEGKRSLSR